MSACREGTNSNNKRRAGNYCSYTGIASDNASKKIAVRAYCGCRPIKSTIPIKYDVIVLSSCEQHEHAQFGCGDLGQMINAEGVL
jgi:hypothetical protein